MAGSDADGDAKNSPPHKKTRQSCRTGKNQPKDKNRPVHDISEESSGDEGGSGKNKPSDEPGFSTNQMQQFASILSQAMGSALASVSGWQSQNALRDASFGDKDGGAHEDEEKDSDSEDKGEGRELDEVDEYDKSLDNLIENRETFGPEISEKVGRVLSKCLGPALDEKVAKEKRDSYPRPENVKNLGVPRLNPEIYKRISGERQFADKAMQQIQSFSMAGMTAVGYQAELAWSIRNWFNSLKEEEKEKLPPELHKLGKMYVSLMDALLLFTRAMWETTSLRRKIVKNELVEPYKSLVDDEKNPASPEWLAGNDVHAAIRKAKDNAVLADKITAKSNWSGGNRKRSHSSDRRGARSGFGGMGAVNQGRGGGHYRQDSDRGRSKSRPSSSRGRGYDNNNGNDRRDFYRRDSR